MRRVGPYEAVQFNDPVIYSVLDFMEGWAAIDNWKPAEMVWKQKEFERLYAVMARSKKHPSYLPGIHETDNANNGVEAEREIIKIRIDDGDGRPDVVSIAEVRP